MWSMAAQRLTQITPPASTLDQLWQRVEAAWSSADFPKVLGLAMDTFLLCCDDENSDVRLMADECLNRTIKTLLDSHLGRLLVELFKEIKKNSSARSLRAALSRFGDICHLMRSQKCRPYTVNLVPALAKICQRNNEELVQETLALAINKLMPVLGQFANDKEVKMGGRSEPALVIRLVISLFSVPGETLCRVSAVPCFCQMTGTRPPFFWTLWWVKAYQDDVQFMLIDPAQLCLGKGLVLPTCNIDNVAVHMRFLLIFLRNYEMSKKSPFAVHKALVGIGGEPKSVKPLRSADLLIEPVSAMQTKSFLLAKTFLDSSITISPRKSLNTC
ncbi:huntingtin [Trichonephila clavipes]|nr:huntingtin [Trichonephila clavipes]